MGICQDSEKEDGKSRVIEDRKSESVEKENG